MNHFEYFSSSSSFCWVLFFSDFQCNQYIQLLLISNKWKKFHDWRQKQGEKWQVLTTFFLTATAAITGNKRIMSANRKSSFLIYQNYISFGKVIIKSLSGWLQWRRTKKVWKEAEFSLLKTRIAISGWKSIATQKQKKRNTKWWITIKKSAHLK